MVVFVIVPFPFVLTIGLSVYVWLRGNDTGSVTRTFHDCGVIYIYRVSICILFLFLHSPNCCRSATLALADICISVIAQQSFYICRIVCRADDNIYHKGRNAVVI